MKTGTIVIIFRYDDGSEEDRAIIHNYHSFKYKRPETMIVKYFKIALKHSKVFK